MSADQSAETPANAFTSWNLYPGLQSALDSLKLTTPTDVQAQVMPLAQQGSDLLVCARTGTGKTLAFLLPALQKLLANPLPNQGGTLVLILTPTRELARQVAKHCETLCKSTPLNSLLITGGESLNFQTAELRKNPEIVIATTGRLLEVMERQAIDLSTLQTLILDEADRVLEMGFGEDVHRIAEACAADRQTLLVSATLNRKGMGALTRTLLRNPVKIDLTKEQQGLIEHQRLLSDDRHHKNNQLVWLLRELEFGRALVFANTRHTCEQLFTLLKAQSLDVGVLHGEKEQHARKAIMTKFRQGSIKILVASDVAARGLDISDVELVINFDLPRRGDDYLHRVGRTGRAGNEGKAISLVEPGEWNLMISLQRYLKIEMAPLIIEALAGKFKGPKNTKSSGKTAGKKKKKKDGKKGVGKTAGKTAGKAAGKVSKSGKPAANKSKHTKPKGSANPPKPKRAASNKPVLTGEETLKRRKRPPES